MLVCWVGGTGLVVAQEGPSAQATRRLPLERSFSGPCSSHVSVSTREIPLLSLPYCPGTFPCLSWLRVDTRIAGPTSRDRRRDAAVEPVRDAGHDRPLEARTSPLERRPADSTVASILLASCCRLGCGRVARAGLHPSCIHSTIGAGYCLPKKCC